MTDTQRLATRPRVIGFVGLGLLGLALALRLRARGFELVGWNREPHRHDALAHAGGSIAASPREVAERADILCLCVLDGNAVRDVVFGPDGLSAAPANGKPILDFSTVDPEETVAIARRAADVGFTWIDAPVSGGPAAAAVGDLTVMVGGEDAAIDRVKHVLDAVASSVTRLGPVGTGQAMKVVNQALVGSTFVLVAEALALARELGLPVEAVPGCLAGGMADSAALQRAWPRMVAEDFDPPTGRAAQMLKDLDGVDRARRAADLALPMLELARARYRAYVDSGAGEKETVSIARLYGPRHIA